MLEQLNHVDDRRLYQQIADRIRGLIDDGSFAIGSRLPPERELASTLGVSRPSVREALIALEIEGSVEVRMGAGVYVCGRSQRRPGRGNSLGESPTELMQARLALEGSVIVMACARVTAQGLKPVREAVNALRLGNSKNRVPVQHDRQFHVGIAALTGNAVIVRLVGELFDERHSPIASTLRGRSENASTWAAALDEHEAIFRALEERDALRAQMCMRVHLDASQRRWLESN